ncbi:hypothetical protein GS502_11115 [Rhodococcus hoagii]|nr:hypothetical protein [Prescottella equi]
MNPTDPNETRDRRDADLRVECLFQMLEQQLADDEKAARVPVGTRTHIVCRAESGALRLRVSARAADGQWIDLQRRVFPARTDPPRGETP